MLEVVNDLPQPSMGHLKGFSPVEEEELMTQALAATLVNSGLTRPNRDHFCSVKREIPLENKTFHCIPV